jgi:hypothetical protein
MGHYPLKSLKRNTINKYVDDDDDDDDDDDSSHDEDDTHKKVKKDVNGVAVVGVGFADLDTIDSPDDSLGSYLEYNVKHAKLPHNPDPLVPGPFHKLSSANTSKC